jgi:hypothetical protein
MTYQDYQINLITIKYNNKLDLYGLGLESDGAEVIEQWTVGPSNLIVCNGDYEIYCYQGPSITQYRRDSYGLVTNQLEFIEPNPYIIYLSKKRKKIYVYTKYMTEYRPLLAAHQLSDSAKFISAKKDISIFEIGFRLVDDYFEKNRVFDSYANELLAGELDLEYLTANEKVEFYWHLKRLVSISNKFEDEYVGRSRNEYGRHLIDYANKCIEMDDLGVKIKLEMWDFIELQERNPTNTSAEKIFIQYDLDMLYKYFEENKTIISSNELNKIVDNLAAQVYYTGDVYGYEKKLRYKQILKLASMQMEKIRRDPSEDNYLKLLEFMELMSSSMFKYFIEAYDSELNFIFETYLVRSESFLRYVDMYLEKGEYKMSFEYLSKAEVSPEIKWRILMCKVNMEGIIAATDYLMDQEPLATSWNSAMSEAITDISPKERYDLIKHLYRNYKKSLDSLDFTVIFEFKYVNICHYVVCRERNQEPVYIISSDKLWEKENTDKEYMDEKYDFIIKILKEFGYADEYKYYRDSYSLYQIVKESAAVGCGFSMCYEVINNYVKDGRLSRSTASDYIYQQAFSKFESISGRGQRYTAEFEKPYNEVIDLCNKSLGMNPDNGLNYKLLGDVYSFMAYHNKSQYYYGLAEKRGVYMKDRILPSGGKSGIKTGPRGGRYYINSNGNRTYVR